MTVHKKLERRHGIAALVGGIGMGILVGAAGRGDPIFVVLGVAIGATSAPAWLALGELRHERQLARRDSRTPQS